MRGQRALGTPWRTVACRVLVFTGIVAVPLSALSMLYAGIGWDARIDTGQSLLIRQVIPNLPAGTSLQAAYDEIYFTAEFYGILLPQLGDALHFITTGSGELLQLNDLATYRFQGLANLFLATMAAAALAFAIRATFRSGLAGAFCWALLMFTPIYFGMSTMNIKDMPVAAGLTLTSAGLMLTRTGRSPGVRWGLASALVSLGTGIAIATRPGLWPLVAAFIALSVGLWLVADGFSGNLRRSAPSVLGATLAVPFTLLLLWWSNPFGRLALFPWLWDSFTVMRNYPWEGLIRTAGQDLSSTDLPWWYTPAWLLAQLPLLTTITIGMAFVVVLFMLVRRRRSIFAFHLVSATPVFVQALVLPLAVIVSGATLYDGIRHLLFVVPALVAIGSVTVARFDHVDDQNPPALAKAAGIYALVVVIMSAWATIRWMPYSYAFINPIAGVNQPQRDWELDYWGLSAFEGVDRLRQENLNVVGVLPTEETSVLFGGGSVAGTAEASQGSPYGLYVFKRGDYSIGECHSIFTIMRDGQILGEGARCPGETLQSQE